MTADQIVEHETVLSGPPTTLVIDHLGRLPPAPAPIIGPMRSSGVYSMAVAPG